MSGRLILSLEDRLRLAEVQGGLQGLAKSIGNLDTVDPDFLVEFLRREASKLGDFIEETKP